MSRMKRNDATIGSTPSRSVVENLLALVRDNMEFCDPKPDCGRCPRLVEYRQQNREAYPTYFNAPVPSFGSLDAKLLIVGLAPGREGANRTGRPFTGDDAGDVLCEALLRVGFARGTYGGHIGDGLQLVNCRVTNAVRCAPPENKPKSAEAWNCNAFLTSEIATMPNLTFILTIGKDGHNAVLRSLGKSLASMTFMHGAIHTLTDTLRMVNSYHCSRYNINTGRLTQQMLDDVLAVVHSNL